MSLVEERTEGRVRISHYDTSQLGSGRQQIEALALGTQHVYFGSGSAVSILVPAYGVIDIAFLFRDREHFDAFLSSDMIDTLNDRLLSEFHIRVFAMNWFRKPRYLLHRERFIRGPADMKGARARAPNLPMFITNWENMGAVPVKVAFFEQYLALSQNLVEMTEASGDDIYPMKLHEVAPYKRRRRDREVSRSSPSLAAQRCPGTFIAPTAMLPSKTITTGCVGDCCQ